jgi:hypothetical protein
MDMFKSIDRMELTYFDSRGGGESLMLLHDFTTSSLVDWEETGGSVPRSLRTGFVWLCSTRAGTGNRISLMLHITTGTGLWRRT